ncbi:hypothetical protein DES53_104458 [Roseimicrobium gellanilyticum]|uniref:Uncharacterized protein n=1 Tax=Roseimicrobium gellanilyticum TaxID=748857 RepID=A0A366HPC3_9BACT|nr:hypothetical protein DES53_104458 [Roseimicrobium gellanilyticum]
MTTHESIETSCIVARKDATNAPFMHVQGMVLNHARGITTPATTPPARDQKKATTQGVKNASTHKATKSLYEMLKAFAHRSPHDPSTLTPSPSSTLPAGPSSAHSRP